MTLSSPMTEDQVVLLKNQAPYYRDDYMAGTAVLHCDPYFQ
jgi:hypothetical protein